MRFLGLAALLILLAGCSSKTMHVGEKGEEGVIVREKNRVHQTADKAEAARYTGDE